MFAEGVALWSRRGRAPVAKEEVDFFGYWDGDVVVECWRELVGNGSVVVAGAMGG